jgi:hypothetical protein
MWKTASFTVCHIKVRMRGDDSHTQVMHVDVGRKAASASDAATTTTSSDCEASLRSDPSRNGRTRCASVHGGGFGKKMTQHTAAMAACTSRWSWQLSTAQDGDGSPRMRVLCAAPPPPGLLGTGLSLRQRRTPSRLSEAQMPQQIESKRKKHNTNNITKTNKKSNQRNTSNKEQKQNTQQEHQ